MIDNATVPTTWPSFFEDGEVAQVLVELRVALEEHPPSSAWLLMMSEMRPTS
jgi:hypothetical protein